MSNIDSHIHGSNSDHGGYGEVRVIWKEECYLSFALRRNYVCKMHGLRERKRKCDIQNGRK